MSCIGQILSITNNEPYLVADRGIESDGFVIEGGGEYKGYEFLVTFTDMGHRCGYVALPANHPLNTRSANFDSYNDIDCHGGVTFASSKHQAKSRLGIECTDRWIGFDCAHLGDAKDFDNVNKYFGENAGLLRMYEKLPHLDKYNSGTIKSFEFVTGDCKKVIDQLINMETVV